METWKNIPNAENYMVSNLGRIKSLDRFVPPGRGGKTKRHRKGQLIRYSIDGSGYAQCRLGFYHIEGLSRKVHRLVLLAFIGESDLDVNHKDGNKLNNALDNLEYVTKSENHIHCRTILKKLSGDNHWNCRFKKIERDKVKSDWITGKFTINKLSVKYGCRWETINRILNNEN